MNWFMNYDETCSINFDFVERLSIEKCGDDFVVTARNKDMRYELTHSLTMEDAQNKLAWFVTLLRTQGR